MNKQGLLADKKREGRCSVKALYEHCINTEISELNIYLWTEIFVKFNGEQCGVKVSYLKLDYP